MTENLAKVPHHAVEEVPTMVDPEIVRQIRTLAALKWGAKRIAKELGIARNTVRRYLRHEEPEPAQVRPKRRRLGPEQQAEARRMFRTLAAGNAVVVTRELRRLGAAVSVRTVQRAVAAERREKRAAEVATIRFETVPGQQMQVDFGQKQVTIGGQPSRVHLLVAVLGYSRRLYVQAFLAERGDDWREGIAGAFRHFDGVPQEVLGDNARALVVDRDRETQTVRFHPAYLAFCRDWGVVPRACRPYRARTKGKTESGVKYVKRNALAGREFESFTALEAHLAECVRRQLELPPTSIKIAGPRTGSRPSPRRSMRPGRRAHEERRRGQSVAPGTEEGALSGDRRRSRRHERPHGA